MRPPREIVIACVVASTFGCSSAPPPGPPQDPFVACTSVAQTNKGADAARDLVEAQTDARVIVTPMTEERMTARFGVSSAFSTSLWEVSIDVKKLPEGMHLTFKPPRFTADCKETDVKWVAVWPDALAKLFPDPPAPKESSSPAPVPPLYLAEPPPDQIPKGDNPLWEKLDAATGKAHSNKRPYRLTEKDKTAWATAEEAKRAEAQKAHDEAAAERNKRIAELADAKAAYDKDRRLMVAAREKVHEGALPSCQPQQSVSADEIIFVSPGRCTFFAIPSTTAPPAAKKCTAPVSLVVDAQWIVEKNGQPCMLDAQAKHIFKKGGSAPELLPVLFEKGAKTLREVRGSD